MALALGALAGCGKEVGRIPFTGEGNGSGSMSLKAGEVSFWTDIDVSYEGDAALAYHIELSQGGSKVATASCNPLGSLPVKTSWVESNVGSSHSRRGMGKMPCSVTLATGGSTAISAKLAFSKTPAKLALKQADLVIKQ
jgi:hypothetical protein